MGPLIGTNILDLGTAGVGPRAASLLGMMGANVIKVEPPFGDALRMQLPFMRGVPTAYIFCNLNKRCISLDLKDEANRGIMEQLVREADVLIQNLRPGVMERLGLGYETVNELNPSIVYVECPGWGFQGEMRGKAAVAGVIDAFGGFTSLHGSIGGRPERFPYAYTDFNASNYIAAATLVGIYARERTGQGQRIQLSQLGTTIATEIGRIAEYFATGKTPVPLGHASAFTAPHEAFLCQDNRYLAVGVETEGQWRQFCEAIGLNQLQNNPKFGSNVKRVRHQKDLSSILQKEFRTRPSRWWAIRLEKRKVPHGHFFDFEIIRNHSQVIKNGLMPVIKMPQVGHVYAGGVPWEFSKTPATLGTAPRPGQQTDEITKKGFGSDGHKPKSSHAVSSSVNGVPPLSGLKVVDISQGVSGPFASLLMALSGAEVTKVEPLSGDYARNFAPQDFDGEAAFFVQLNRNKSGIVLDIESAAERQKLRELLRNADVFIEDLGPGKANRLGLGYDQLVVRNPGLIYCAITAFGERGPMKDMPGSELVTQAIACTCVHRPLGAPDDPPVRVGDDIAGLSTGLTAFQGIMAALVHRQRAGNGQRIAISMLGSMLSMWGNQWAAMTDPDDWAGHSTLDTRPRQHGIPTSDGDIHLSAPTLTHEGAEEELAAFGKEIAVQLGITEILEEPLATQLEQNSSEFAQWIRRQANENTDLWGRYFRGMSKTAVIDLVSRSPAVIAVPVNTIKEVLEHSQFHTLGMLDFLQMPNGHEVTVVGLPWKGLWENVRAAPSPRLSANLRDRS